jgi:hypothetical protein
MCCSYVAGCICDDQAMKYLQKKNSGSPGETDLQRNINTRLLRAAGARRMRIASHMPPCGVPTPEKPGLDASPPI